MGLPEHAQPEHVAARIELESIALHCPTRLDHACVNLCHSGPQWSCQKKAFQEQLGNQHSLLEAKYERLKTHFQQRTQAEIKAKDIQRKQISNINQAPDVNDYPPGWTSPPALDDRTHIRAPALAAKETARWQTDLMDPRCRNSWNHARCHARPAPMDSCCLPRLVCACLLARLC